MRAESWIGFFASVYDYARGGARWPLAMIFVSPVVVLYLLAVAPEGLRAHARRRRRQLCVLMYAIAIAACLPYVYMGAVSG